MITVVLIATVGVVLLAAQVLVYWRLAVLVRRTHGPSRDMYQRGFELGKNAGFREGHRTARPVVVPFVSNAGEAS